MNRRQSLQHFAASTLLSGALPVFAAPAAPAAPVTPAKYKLALVLGAGTARGFAHIGFIKALERAHIKPDLIVGCSAGALVGSFYAHGYNASEMEAIAHRVRDTDIVDPVPGNTKGLLQGEALQRFVNNYVKNKPLEQLSTRFVAVSTNLRTGEAVMLQTGDTGLAVRASCAMPGVFLPAPWAGKYELVDGAVSSPLPIAQARALGAQNVIVCDVSGLPTLESQDATGLYEVVMRSFDIMSWSLTRQQSQQADILVRPDTKHFSSTDFGNRADMIAAGFSAGQKAVPDILKYLGRATTARAPR